VPHRLLRERVSWPPGGIAARRTCPACGDPCQKARSSADGHARPVVVDNELLSRKPVVPFGATDGEFPGPIEDELSEAKVEAVPSTPLASRSFQDLLEQRQEDPVLPLVRQFRNVLDAEDEAAPLDPVFATSNEARTLKSGPKIADRSASLRSRVKRRRPSSPETQ
jgi:hypothetical protein